MKLSSSDWFRSRRIGQFFPIGAAVLVILGIVAAPRLVGPSVLMTVVAGCALGLAGSALLFLVLLFLDRR